MTSGTDSVEASAKFVVDFVAKTVKVASSLTAAGRQTGVTAAVP